MSVRNVRLRVGSYANLAPYANQATILAQKTAPRTIPPAVFTSITTGAIQSATYVKRRITAMIVFGITAVLIQPAFLGVTPRLTAAAFRDSTGKTENAKSVSRTISASTGSSWRVRSIH